MAARAVYEGSATAAVREEMGKAIKTSFREIVRERVRSRLSNALDSEHVEEDIEEDGDGIETTQEEVEGFLTVKAIVRSVVDSKRVHIRDAKSYCAILLDDNNRRPLARLHFNGKKKLVGLFDGDKEDRVPIEQLDDIYHLSERITATARKYD
ncbi:hypothetical protein MWU52_09605 [Jannaschia sp. S6380]|uniref:hypothetical protein n=1 Tax=Jannaschia sp. S6380 TaxID=2926408 RepID=UPI001FF32A50|nr:hypothetical protein [Jannaschia sp. S6380]MCK0167801.1 hypothetical protein [Jannaschia sp. S6380]